jgi:hypothetical protein
VRDRIGDNSFYDKILGIAEKAIVLWIFLDKKLILLFWINLALVERTNDQSCVYQEVIP